MLNNPFAIIGSLFIMFKSLSFITLMILKSSYEITLAIIKLIKANNERRKFKYGK